MKVIENSWVRRWVIGVLPFYLVTFLPLNAQKPWTFWYWMYGAVSEAGVKADLQAMKDVGLGGCYLMPIRGAAERPEYGGNADALSDNFWRMVDIALAQADSLGLDMGIHVCDGFALAGGPWISPEESMQKVVFCDTIMGEGHHHFTMAKPQHYQDYYEDIAVYAIPVNQSTTPLGSPKGRFTYSPEVTINAKGVYCADEPCWLQYEFDEPTLVCNIEIEPSGTNIQCQRLLVKASDDGIIFHQVKQLVPPRQGWQNTGFNTTFSIPPTTAKYFRFEWTPEGSEPGAEDLDAAKWKAVLRLKNMTLHSWPLLDNWEGKAGYVWRIAPDTPEEDVSNDDFLRPSDLVITKMQGDLLDINLPKGQWRILRMGHTSTGHTNATAGGAKGLECDKFSRKTVGKQIDSWFGRFMQRPNHRAIKYMHVDSWECGSQNWSRNFAQEFERRRGYDILPLLPLYAGVPMSGGEEVLRDIRLTINELINEVFFTTAAQKAREYGVQLSSESVAPTMVSDGMEHYKYVDVPMGEYWLNSPTHDKPNDMLDAISAAHVYGKNIVQAEGFTEVRGVWDETPAFIKPLLDRNFALGMNRLFFHVFTHNPYMDKKPGMTLDGIGLFFQRDQTWFPEAKAFVDYATRCQTLLQQGKPVVDIAVYTGDEMSRRALTPDKLVPMLPEMFGQERLKSEEKRYDEAAFFMEESPVGVRHSFSIFNMRDWVNPLHGYQYDSMNPDALLHQPFNYKALVIPENALISREARQRIEQLRKDGVQIIDRPYHADTLKTIEPDVKLPDGLAYTHRRDDATNTDIYFICNQHDLASGELSFRITDRKPYIYDAEADEYHSIPSEVRNGRTIMKQSFTSKESMFVIFNDNMPATHDYTHTEGGGILTLDKPWKIEFLENGKQITTQYLVDWSKQTDDSIKYYSGRARYTSAFTLKKKDMQTTGPTFLDLGSVRDVAHVWINGIDCGIAWHYPYRVNVSKAIRKGKNHLTIEVVNTWHNALCGLDQGKAPYAGIWTNAKYRRGGGLLPAGLLGAYFCYAPNSIVLTKTNLKE